MERTVALIGFGNMAQAMARGWLRAGAVRPANLRVCAKNWEKLCENARPLGVTPCRTAEEAAKGADWVILAVKPYLLPQILPSLRETLQGKTVLSVAAGYPFEKLEELLPGISHLSLMPNTPVQVGEGVILCESRHSLPEETFREVQAFLGTIALVEEVDPKQFGIAGVVTGCGPAFVSMMIEALGDAAVKNGLPRAAAYRLAGQMVAGTGKLLVESGEHPGAMKDAVCSPGGTTIVGVAALEKHGFRSAVIDAIDSIEKHQRLAPLLEKAMKNIPQ